MKPPAIHSPGPVGAQELVSDVATLTQNLDRARRRLTAAEEAFQPLRQLIRKVDAGLPNGVGVVTMTSACEWDGSPKNAGNPSMGCNDIYARRASGYYEADGAIKTLGKELPFIGSRILLDRGQLVIINDDIRLGLAAKQHVFLAPANSELHDQFMTELVPLLDQRTVGGYKEYDLTPPEVDLP